MSELKTYRILVERIVTVVEVNEIDIEAASKDEAMDIAERLYNDGVIDFDEVSRDINDVYFSEV